AGPGGLAARLSGANEGTRASGRDPEAGGPGRAGNGPATYRVAVIPGDGTGPEVVREGRKVLSAVAEAEGFALDPVDYDLGGERDLRSGETLPDPVLGELRDVDAIYLGAVGHPDVRPGILERDLLLRIRFELDQYVNWRPVRPYPGVSVPLARVDPS